MYRIIDNRGSGKTSRLMLFAKEQGAKIACKNPIDMQKKAYAYGIVGVDFIPYSDLLNGSISPDDKIMIDEIECFLRNYIDGNFIGYTLSNED